MQKYKYLYDVNNKLTHYSEAVRGADYKLYKEDTEYLFTYKKGDLRNFFTLKIENPLFNGGGGESPEHHNAKMEIVYEKKYFDTIFDEWVYFDYAIAEKKINKKIPDVQCFQNDKLVCIIEIFNTNKKTEEDIEKLRVNRVPLIEIDINNENRCKHLILPEVLESNKRKYIELTEKHRQLKNKEQEFKEEIRNPRETIIREIVDSERESTGADYNEFEGKIRDINKRIEHIKNQSYPEINKLESGVLQLREKLNKTNKEIKNLSNPRVYKIKTDIEERTKESGNIKEKRKKHVQSALLLRRKIKGLA
jgi:hypothetical protein